MVAKMSEKPTARAELLDQVEQYDWDAAAVVSAEAADSAARAEYAAAAAEWQKYVKMEENAYRDGWLPKLRAESQPAEARFQSARSAVSVTAARVVEAKRSLAAMRVELGQFLFPRGLRCVLLADGRCLIDHSFQPTGPPAYKLNGETTGPPPIHDAAIVQPTPIAEI